MTLEIDPDNQKRITTGFQLIRIVLGFIVITVAVITILPHLGIIKLNQGSLGAESSLTNIFLIIALFLAVLGLSARKLLSKVEKKENYQEHISACLKSIHISHLAAFAIFEAIAIIGFVNFMISADPQSNLIFSAISLAGMVFCWPKLSQLLGMIGPEPGSRPDPV